MINLWNRFNRWRESRTWLPAWLDDKDWKSWVWHTVITIVTGHVIGAILWVIAVLAGSIWSYGTWASIGTWGMVIGYVVTETKTRMDLDWHYKPSDYLGDTLGPAIGATLITLWWL